MFDKIFSDHMTALADEVSSAAWLAPAAKVRARGDRRRIQLTGAVAVGAGVLTATTGVVMASGGPTIGTGGPRAIPDTLVMPHEGDPRWDRDDNPRIASVFNPCGGEDPTLAGRTDARTVSGVVPQGDQDPVPLVVTTQLFLFRTNEAAEAAITELSRRSEADCGWFGGWAPTMGLGQFVVLARTMYPHEDHRPRMAVAVRKGNAIYVSHIESNSGSVLDPLFEYEAAKEMNRRLCEALGLCEPLTCYFRSPMPGPTASLTANPTQAPLDHWRPYPCDQNPSDVASPDLASPGPTPESPGESRPPIQNPRIAPVITEVTRQSEGVVLLRWTSVHPDAAYFIVRVGGDPNLPIASVYNASFVVLTNLPPLDGSYCFQVIADVGRERGVSQTRCL